MDDLPSGFVVSIERQFGPLRLTAVKPLSVALRTTDDQILIKVYCGITPAARQQRELEALRMASRFGLMVPRVLGDDRTDGYTWTAFEVVPGVPCDLADGADLFVELATQAISTLHRHEPSTGAGSGWTQRRTRQTVRISDHLAAQLSTRAHAMSWWPPLVKRLRALDDLPVVYLHGDVKPEHLLVSSNGLHLVDWEACARGPAVCDHADMLFHLTRDLIYADDLKPRVPDLSYLSPHISVALAWRLALWADRRRNVDLSLLPGNAVFDLLGENRAEAAVEMVAGLIREMRRAGTPR